MITCTCDFTQINALCRNKISILCRNTNIQRAGFTIHRQNIMVFPRKRKEQRIFFNGYHPTMIYANAGKYDVWIRYNVCRSLRKRERIDHDYPTTDSGNSRHAEATHFTPTQEANRINNPTALSTCESTRRLLLTCDLLKELSLQIFISSALCERNL